MFLALAATRARADEIPIVTLSDVGPNQEIPTGRSFFVEGEIAPTVENAQAIIVRKGSAGLFGDDGPACHQVISDLHVDVTSTSDDDDDDDDLAPPELPARYPAGVHRIYELFPRAAGELRDGSVLVTAPWQRRDDAAREYRLLVPHDAEFFTAGHGYCMLVVATDRGQQLDDATLGELIDTLGRTIVGCGDKSSCDDDALADYESRLARRLRAADASAGSAEIVAQSLKEAARVELASTAGIIEARDHLQDRWNDETRVMTPTAQVVWADTSTDPFAHALATLLARSAALLPQVRPSGRGTQVALFTTDGRLQVRALQILEDGRSIRVASSRAPAGDQARVITATTDALAVADGVTLYDLIELGASRIRVDGEWVTLPALGERLSALGLDGWTADDAAFLVAAAAQMRRLSELVDSATNGVTCPSRAFEPSEADQTSDAVRRHLGEWLVCQHVDASALEALTEQLDELVHEDHSWNADKDKLYARSRRIVTLTTTAPVATRVEFSDPTWLFSYVTPFAGYAGIVEPDESFGLFYLGAQLHFAPNPIDEVLWRHGVTARDLRRAFALELGVAPYGGSFGPDHRYDGVGNLPPVFVGLALHVIPYTSLTAGGTLLDRKDSTLSQELPHAIFAPYFGFTIQLNLPDLIRTVARGGSDTTAFR